MKEFGGNWTDIKIEIFIKYVKAYLEIMKDRKYWKLIYFDGFAGSGEIIKSEKSNFDLLEGMAKRILQIDGPRIFDMYYFVDTDEKNTEKLKAIIDNEFLDKKKIAHVVNGDCNIKLNDLAAFLVKPENKHYKVLAFIDPYGMQVNWSSLSKIQGLPVDMWILVPTGIGVNRLLKRNGQISDNWLRKLQLFLGLSEEEIISFFYKEEQINTLFGIDKKVCKENEAIEKAALLYKMQLEKIFKFVSDPYVMKNKTGSILFHFYMGSNNRVAQKIANEIIKPYFAK
ncbi:MAG: three-Cys-motif partner protein TcmP [Bacteroidetes bacterium]|nr:three-Cys-motif partner protein TcmP [Bacteroidota bacterium]